MYWTQAWDRMRRSAKSAGTSEELMPRQWRASSNGGITLELEYASNEDKQLEKDDEGE